MAKYENQFSLFVTGEPKAQGRPRFARMGAFVKTYSPKTQFFGLVYNAVLQKFCRLRLQGPLSLRIHFYMPRPKYAMRGKHALLTWHTAKPDLDNMEKAVMDAMTNAGVWGDDSQICEKATAKSLVPVNGGILPGAFIWVAQIAQPTDGTPVDLGGAE